MNDEQKYKLNKVVDTVTDVLDRTVNGDEPSGKIMATWLSMSGKYCCEVADELRANSDNS